MSALLQVARHDRPVAFAQAGAVGDILGYLGEFFLGAGGAVGGDRSDASRPPATTQL